MLLSDRDIRAAMRAGDLEIEPDHGYVQPASVDVCLGAGFRVMIPGHEAIDPMNVVDYTGPVDHTSITLHQGEFVLAQTAERVRLGPGYAAKLEGKSSLGRLGLILHATAGFIDPGFSGTITLELSLSSPRPLVLYSGMKIGQLAFFKLSSPAEVPYGSEQLGSKYQGQSSPTPSRYKL